MSGLVGNSQRHILSCRGSDINVAAKNLNQILLDSAKKSLKVVNNHQNNSSTKLNGGRGLKTRNPSKHNLIWT